MVLFKRQEADLPYMPKGVQEGRQQMGGQLCAFQEQGRGVVRYGYELLCPGCPDYHRVLHHILDTQSPTPGHPEVHR